MKTTNKYILQAPDYRTPVPCDDLLLWGRAFEKLGIRRRVAQDAVGNVRISTVFLGLDHNFGGDGPPLLWETMVFGGTYDQECLRYATYDEARAGHIKVVEKITKEQS